MHWQTRSPLCWIVAAVGALLFTLTAAAQIAQSEPTAQSLDQANSSSPIGALLKTAQEFFDAGRYELADKRYRQILALDPDNEAAALGREQVRAVKEQHAKRASEVLEPEHGVLSMPPSVMEREPDPAVVRHKLGSINIPFFEVYSMPLKDVLELLQKQAAIYDTDTDGRARGVKIDLDLSAPRPQLQVQENAGIPGLPPGAEQAVAEPVTNAPPNGDTRLSLTLAHAPLGAVLDYVARAVNLKVKTGPRSVSIVPLYDYAGELTTMEIRVPPSFIEPPSVPSPSPAQLAETGSSNLLVQTRVDAKVVLESNGVTFPPGASAVYLRETNKLIIRNTQANLDLVQVLVGENTSPTASPTPVQ